MIKYFDMIGSKVNKSTLLCSSQEEFLKCCYDQIFIPCKIPRNVYNAVFRFQISVLVLELFQL